MDCALQLTRPLDHRKVFPHSNQQPRDPPESAIRNVPGRDRFLDYATLIVQTYDYLPARRSRQRADIGDKTSPALAQVSSRSTLDIQSLAPPLSDRPNTLCP